MAKLIGGDMSPAAQEALDSVERQWNMASKNWDPEKFGAIYTDDALFFGGRAPHYVGKSGVLDYFQSYVGVISAATLELVDQHVHDAGPQAFMAQGFGQFRLNMASGTETDLLQRTTLLITRRNSQWKIASHHFSSRPEAPPLPN